MQVGASQPGLGKAAGCCIQQPTHASADWDPCLFQQPRVSRSLSRQAAALLPSKTTLIAPRSHTILTPPHKTTPENPLPAVPGTSLTACLTSTWPPASQWMTSPVTPGSTGPCPKSGVALRCGCPALLASPRPAAAAGASVTLGDCLCTYACAHRAPAAPCITYRIPPQITYGSPPAYMYQTQIVANNSQIIQ